jgi:hypothetical protein
VAEHATQERASSGIDAHDLPATVNFGDLDLVGDDDAPPHQINEVTGEKIFGEQQLTRTTLEATEIDPTPFECHATLREPANLTHRNKEVAPFDANDGAHDGGVRVVAKTRDQVLDASDPVAVRVKDRTVQKS